MFTSSLVRDANVCVFVIRDSGKKKKQQKPTFLGDSGCGFAKREDCLDFVSFPDGRVSTAVKQKQNQPPKTEGHGLHQCV